MISPVNRLTLAVGMVIATLVGQATAAPVALRKTSRSNLIRLLVQQGVLTQDTANGLIAQAEKEAQQARQANAAPVVASGRRRHLAMCACSMCRKRCAIRSAIRSRPKSWPPPSRKTGPSPIPSRIGSRASALMAISACVTSRAISRVTTAMKSSITPSSMRTGLTTSTATPTPSCRRCSTPVKTAKACSACVRAWA